MCGQRRVVRVRWLLRLGRSMPVTRTAVARLAAWALASMLLASAAGAHEGWGIVRDSLGRLYIADIPANTVWRIDRSGRLEAVIRDVHSHALVIGADGAVYGTHVHLTEPVSGVWRLDLSGKRTSLVEPSRALPISLQPFLIAGDGSVYSSSIFQYSRAPEARELYLLRRSPGGVFYTVAGGLTGRADGNGAAARFESIDGMAWLPDSAILLVDGARLRRVDRNGVVHSLTPDLTTRRWDEDLMGVSVSADSSMYVADFSGRQVLRVRDGEPAILARTRWLWAPTGVTHTSDGVYTLEHLRAPLGILGDLRVGPYLRVRHIAGDGRTRVVARRWGDRTGLAALVAGSVSGLLLLIARRR